MIFRLKTQAYKASQTRYPFEANELIIKLKLEQLINIQRYQIPYNTHIPMHVRCCEHKQVLQCFYTSQIPENQSMCEAQLSYRPFIASNHNHQQYSNQLNLRPIKPTNSHQIQIVTRPTYDDQTNCPEGPLT